MSEKYTSQIKFIGNKAVKVLYNEIVKRFQDDRIQGNPELTSIKRILFGLDGDAEFNSFEETGANWAYALDRKSELDFFSPNVPVHKLQDYITKYAAKVDPNVIVEMNYIGNTPELVGSRFTRIDEDGDFFACRLANLRQASVEQGIGIGDKLPQRALTRVIDVDDVAGSTPAPVGNTGSSLTYGLRGRTPVCPPTAGARSRRSSRSSRPRSPACVRRWRRCAACCTTSRCATCNCTSTRAGRSTSAPTAWASSSARRTTLSLTRRKARSPMSATTATPCSTIRRATSSP